jgi:hypothetical protein
MKLLEFIFIDFWHWAGSMLILYVTLYFIVSLLNNFMYYYTMRKIGHPPCPDGAQSPIKEEVKKVNEQNTSNR